jgi:branched-chain amino acid transport system ATP-binding protein
MTAVLETRGLTSGYSGVPVVRRLDLVVNPGEIVGLLGANGAGKTTTLLTVSGILPLLGGELLIDGRSVNRTRPHKIARLGVAHVPEERALFHGLTVAENLQMGTRGRKVDLDFALRHTPALEPLIHRRAGLLSGGEQQMLAVARALQGRPKLLMVDEMSLGLAPLVVRTLLDALSNIAHEDGVAILLVEQHVNLALDLVDRAYVLARGSVVADERAGVLRSDQRMLNAKYLGEELMSADRVDNQKLIYSFYEHGGEVDRLSGPATGPLQERRP